jgi:hypothetical protein
MIEREQVKEIDELKQVDDTNEWRLEGGGVAAVQLATAAAFESKRGRERRTEQKRASYSKITTKMRFVGMKKMSRTRGRIPIIKFHRLFP